jgi:plastocyanin
VSAPGIRRHRLVRRAAAVSAIGGAALVAYAVLPASDDRPQPVEVSMVDYAFVPDDVRAVPGQHLHLVNDGTVPHSMLIVGLGKGTELPPGGEADIRLPADSDGTYALVCDLPGHIEAGMTGSITIDS